MVVAIFWVPILCSVGHSTNLHQIHRRQSSLFQVVSLLGETLFSDFLHCLLPTLVALTTSTWSVSSPNGATFSCFWASSWWSWHCCPERDTRRGSPTSSASSASPTPLVYQAETKQQWAYLEGMYMPTSQHFSKLMSMKITCPCALRRPLL